MGRNRKPTKTYSQKPKKPPKSKQKPKKKSRAGKRFHQGDDLTKVKHDRKLRGGKYEWWEKTK